MCNHKSRNLEEKTNKKVVQLINSWLISYKIINSNSTTNVSALKYRDILNHDGPKNTHKKVHRQKKSQDYAFSCNARQMK